MNEFPEPQKLSFLEKAHSVWPCLNYFILRFLISKYKFSPRVSVVAFFIGTQVFQVLFVCWLLNVVAVFTCLQHLFPAFNLYSVQLPSFKAFLSTLPFSIQYVPIISWMLLLL